MARRRSIPVVLAVVLAVGASLAAPAALGADQAIIAHSGAGYTTPVVVLERGSSLSFVNADPLLPHNVVEDGVPASEARFRSETIPGGSSAPVVGAEALEPGSYAFYCSLHAWMKGSLLVVESSPLPPVPTPTPPDDDGPAPAVALIGGVVPTPTSLFPTAEHLYVTSYAQGAVVRFPFLAAGLLGAPETVASGFNNPLGVAVDDTGVVYVADSHAAGGQTLGRVQAVELDGRINVVVDGLPNGRHNTNNLAIRGDRLYITNGNSTDDGINGGSPEQPLSGTLLSVPLAARGLGADGVVVEATGMRNLYDVAFRPGTNEAWITTNGPDALDPYGEDTLVRIEDIDGAAPDFGFPECLYRADWAILDNPVMLPSTCDPAHTPPAQLLGLHVSADGLAFGPDGDLYIAEFGNFFGSSVVGHKVVRVPIDENGDAGPPEDVLVGVTPLDVAFGPGGLYVADFAAGTVLLVGSP